MDTSTKTALAMADDEERKRLLARIVLTLRAAMRLSR